MTVYALRLPDGRYAYHLPKPSNFLHNVTGVYADGQPMEKLHGDWWASTVEASRLTTTGQPRPKTLSYTLKAQDAESQRYPATLTVDEYTDRRDDEENLWQFYSPVLEDQPAVEHVYDGPVMLLEGREPPGPGERQWIADLPQVLARRPEYRHLFPGHIPGLADHLMDAFKTMRFVDFVGANFQNRPGVHVSLKVPYDEPRTEWRSNTGRNGKPLKSGYHVQVTVNRRLTLPIPSRVPGDTYEQALTAWQEQVEFWTSVVAEASVGACSHCNGNGFVASGSEKYSESIYRSL